MADMTSVARPYAKAAFEIALEHQQINDWSNMLTRLTQIVTDPQCMAFLTNPNATTEQHTHVLLATLTHFKVATDIKEMTQFVTVLAKQKRLLAIPSISALYQVCRASYEKTLSVDVCSFSPLTEEQKQHLTTRLSKRLHRQVTLSERLDPALLGGAIIRAGDLVFDGSVRTQIKKLNRNLLALSL